MGLLGGLRARGASGTQVEGKAGSGEVNLTGVAEVDIETGSSAVEVRDVSGPVTVTTGSGDSPSTSSRQQDVRAQSSSGTISVRQR